MIFRQVMKNIPDKVIFVSVGISIGTLECPRCTTVNSYSWFHIYMPPRVRIHSCPRCTTVNSYSWWHVNMEPEFLVFHNLEEGGGKTVCGWIEKWCALCTGRYKPLKKLAMARFYYCKPKLSLKGKLTFLCGSKISETWRSCTSKSRLKKYYTFRMDRQWGPAI